MADRVEALPLSEQPRRVQLRVQDRFLVVERPREVRAVGSEDRAAAAADRPHSLDLGRQRKVVGVRRLELEVSGCDNVRAALARNVDERLLPGFAVVGSRCDVDLDP